jgi:hypothetical protein
VAKSSFSNGQTNCIEVASTARTVAVRDSKDPSGPALAFAPSGWQAFTRLPASKAHSADRA